MHKYSPRSLNAIASLGFKIRDLYQITMQEFLNKNPDYKKESKEIQKQRYELYEEQRKNNINRCIEKRQEIIANSKKIKPSVKVFKEESEEEEEDIDLDLDYRIKLRNNIKNSEANNYLLRKNYSLKKPNFTPKNKILVTENSYVFNNSSGVKSEITKEDLSKYAYLKDEKKKLERKVETKDDHFMRYLKVQLDRAKKLKKVKAKLEEKEKRIENFMKVKKKGRKKMENERYQDHQGVYERQKIYEKMLENYDQKVFLSKKQQQEKNNFNTLSNDKIGLEKSKSKMEELKGQIKEYERKNIEYQQKINDLFALKDKSEINKKIKERIENKDNKKNDLSTSFSMKKKLNDMEEKLEIEKFRRENALMENMKNFQDKINQYLEKNEQKEEKIKNAIKKAEKEREDRRMVRSNYFNKARENIKKNEIKKESERQKLLESIEKKNLKDFAVKQEKKLMDEKRKKMNNYGRYEREQLKKKVQEIIVGETNYEDGLKSEELLKRLMQSEKKQNQNNDENEEENDEE